MIQYAVEIALAKGHHWREPKESSCEKFETKTWVDSTLGYAFGPGQGSILVFTLVLTGACAFLLYPNHRCGHLRKHTERYCRFCRYAAGWPGCLAGAGSPPALRKCHHRGLTRSFRGEPLAERLSASYAISILKFYRARGRSRCRGDGDRPGRRT